MQVATASTQAAETHTLLSRALTFIASDPPRSSWFASWDPDHPGGLGNKTTDEIMLTLPKQRGAHQVRVGANRLDLASALDLLTPLGRDHRADPTVHAWAQVTRAALSFIAAGKVLPWVSPDGWDTWRVDPLDAADHDLIAALVRAMPAACHATPLAIAGRRTPISDPTFAVRAACDAIADTFIRTPAARRVGSLTLFADPAPTRVPHLRPWVDDLAAAHCSTARLVLRMHPPADGAPAMDQTDDPNCRWTIRFQLQSRTDPSLLVDAADYWHAPDAVIERLGRQAETVLLAGLRHVTKTVEPLADLLDDIAPTSAHLDDAGLDILLEHLDTLADADIDVRWPSALVAPRIERRMVISVGSPQSGVASALDLETLLDVDWEFLLEAVPLTGDELKILSEAKRSVVPLRGRWVRLDRITLERLRAPKPKITPAMALAAALGAEIDIPRPDEIGTDPNEVIDIRVEGGMQELVDRLHALTGGREADEPAALNATLRAYQKRGLAWMSDLCELGLGGCLADDMGLGKTIQVLALHASMPDTGPTLVVCPTSLLRNWQREAARFVPGVDVRIFHGASRTLDNLGDNDIVVTTYGVVRSTAEELDQIRWNLVVADEAQHAKNPRSRTARALRTISHGSRIALTGTPVENKLSELWSIIDWVVPGLLGPLETFRRVTALPIERDGDRKATEALRRIVEPFLLRRKKTDEGIAPELPDKIERDVIVPLTAEQMTLYRATVDTSLAEVAQAEGIGRRGLVLKLLTNLKQITNHPAQFLGETGPLADRSGKLEALDRLLDRAAAANESTLIFSQYVAMGRLLVDHHQAQGRRIELLHGGLSISARQELVDRFQSRDLTTLVLSLKAGGTGLNLTAASNVVHYDRWWNPAVEDQATDRAYRIGQTQIVTVHRLITQGTVEDRVAELLDAKRKLADSVTGGGESWIGELDDDELAELVQLAVA